jgi:hypothetical protein
MKRETADLICPIFRQGLRIKERLRRGERLSVHAEQAELRRLFQMGSPVDLPDTVFLGVRYPVACWLDEVFIEDEDSPWQREFNENKVEQALFTRSLRFDLFWDQAALAEAEGNADALEVFYLCVMLGFRGRLRLNVNKLLDWRDSVETMIASGKASQWPDRPTDLPLPATTVNRALKAKEQLRWLLLSYAVAVGVLILVGGFVLTKLYAD